MIIEVITIFEVILYEDEKGNNPVLEFLTELANTNGKDSRVRLKKVQDYINVTIQSPSQKHKAYRKQQIKQP